jgi:hypothetical protein
MCKFVYLGFFGESFHELLKIKKGSSYISVQLIIIFDHLFSTVSSKKIFDYATCLRNNFISSSAQRKPIYLFF